MATFSLEREGKGNLLIVSFYQGLAILRVEWYQNLFDDFFSNLASFDDQNCCRARSNIQSDGTTNRTVFFAQNVELNVNWTIENVNEKVRVKVTSML